jgi:hypothetical protein
MTASRSENCIVARGRRAVPQLVLIYCIISARKPAYLTSNDSQQVASLAESPEVGGAVPQLVLVLLQKF